MLLRTLSFVLMTTAASALGAASPEVVGVNADKIGMTWRISVALRHDDAGWDHYADGWRIENAAGDVIATRDLLHPHVKEQPFTRSLSSVMVPDGVRELFVRARCSRNGWSDQTYRFELSPDM